MKIAIEGKTFILPNKNSLVRILASEGKAYHVRNIGNNTLELYAPDHGLSIKGIIDLENGASEEKKK